MFVQELSHLRKLFSECLHAVKWYVTVSATTVFIWPYSEYLFAFPKKDLWRENTVICIHRWGFEAVNSHTWPPRGAGHSLLGSLCCSLTSFTPSTLRGRGRDPILHTKLSKTSLWHSLGFKQGHIAWPCCQSSRAFQGCIFDLGWWGQTS